MFFFRQTTTRMLMQARIQELFKMMELATSLLDKLFILEDDLRRNGPTHEWFCVLDSLMLDPDMRNNKEFIALYEDGMNILSQMLMESFRQKFVEIANPITQEQKNLISNLFYLAKSIEKYELDITNPENKKKVLGIQVKIITRLAEYYMAFIDIKIEDHLNNIKGIDSKKDGIINAILQIIKKIKNVEASRGMFMLEIEEFIIQLPEPITPEEIIDELSKLILPSFEVNDFVYQKSEFVYDEKSDMSFPVTVKKPSRAAYDAYFDEVSRFVALDIVIKSNLNIGEALIAINRWINIANRHLEHHDFGGFRAVHGALSKPAVKRLMGSFIERTSDEAREHLPDESRELLVKLDRASHKNHVHNAALKSLITSIDNASLSMTNNLIFIPAIEAIIFNLSKADGVASLQSTGNLQKLLLVGQLLIDMQKVQQLNARKMRLSIDVSEFMGEPMLQMRELHDDELHYKTTMAFSYQHKLKHASGSQKPDEIQAAKTAYQKWKNQRQKLDKAKTYSPAQLRDHITIRDILKTLNTSQPLSSKKNRGILETSIRKNTDPDKINGETLKIIGHLQSMEHRRIYLHTLTREEQLLLLSQKKSSGNKEEPQDESNLTSDGHHRDGKEERHDVPSSRVPSHLTISESDSNGSARLITRSDSDSNGSAQLITQTILQPDNDPNAGTSLQAFPNPPPALDTTSTDPNQVNTIELKSSGDTASDTQHTDNSHHETTTEESTPSASTAMKIKHIHYTKNQGGKIGAQRFFNLAGIKSQERKAISETIELSLMSKLDITACKAIQEFFVTEKTFHQLVKKFIETVKEHLAASFPKKVQFTVNFLLLPYHYCIKNPFEETENPATVEADLLAKLKNIKVNLSPQNKYFRLLLKGLEHCTINYDLFNSIIMENNPLWSTSFHKTRSTFAAIDRRLVEAQIKANLPIFKLADTHIVPTQRLMRIKSLLLPILGEPQISNGVVTYKKGLRGLLTRLQAELAVMDQSSQALTSSDPAKHRQQLLLEIEACNRLCEDFESVLQYIDAEIIRINQTKDLYKHAFEIAHVFEFILEFEDLNAHDQTLLGKLKTQIENIVNQRLVDDHSHTMDQPVDYHQANIRYLKEMNLALQEAKWHFENKSVFRKMEYLQNSIYSTISKIELLTTMNLQIDVKPATPQLLTSHDTNNNNNNNNVVMIPDAPIPELTKETTRKFSQHSDEVEFNLFQKQRKKFDIRSYLASEESRLLVKRG